MHHRLVAAITLAALLPVAAVAQTAPALDPLPSTVLDLNPFMNGVVWPLVYAVAAATIPVIAAYIARKVGRWLNLQNDDTLRAVIETAATNGVALALAKLSDASIRVDTKSEAVAEAARYVMTHVPDALRTLKVTPEKLHEIVHARLEKTLQSPPAATIEVKS